MGRQVSSEEIFMRAKANDYIYKAHHEEDNKSNNSTYVPRKLSHNKWKRWVASVKKEKEDEGVPFSNDNGRPVYTDARSLRAGLTPLDLASTKDFFRFYALTGDEKLDPRLTTESLNSQAERFFAKFTRVTSSIISEQDRAHIYDVSASV